MICLDLTRSRQIPSPGYFHKRRPGNVVSAVVYTQGNALDRAGLVTIEMTYVVAVLLEMEVHFTRLVVADENSPCIAPIVVFTIGAPSGEGGNAGSKHDRQSEQLEINGIF